MKKDRGKDQVRNNGKHNGPDHRVGRGLAHALGPASHVQALVASDEHDEDGKAFDLDQARDDVLGLECFAGAAQVQRRGDAQQAGADDEPAEQAH